MSIKEKFAGIMPKLDAVAEKERQNHYIVNIMMTALFSLIIIFTLFGGVNVNVGSVHNGDGKDVVVRQSFFKVVDTAFSSVMSRESCEEYVEEVNDKLRAHGVIGLPLSVYDKATGAMQTEPPFQSMETFAALIEQVREAGVNPNSINWLKYKYAYARAIVVDDASNLSQWSVLWQSNWQGHISVALAGQSLFSALISLAVLIVSIVMLVFSIIALVKKKPFTKAKLSLMMLLMFVFIRMLFSFSLLRADWSWVLINVLVFLVATAYAVLQHIMMDKKDFSLTMFIRNGVLLLGSILAFILMIVPMFKLTDPDGASTWYGWAYLFDFALAESAYMLAPMSYFLISLLASGVLMLYIIITMVMILKMMSRFLSADYQLNEKRIIMFMIAVLNLFVFIILGANAAAGMGVASLYLTVSLNVAVMIIEPLIVAGMIVFDFLYKAKPIKKEIVIPR